MTHMTETGRTPALRMHSRGRGFDTRPLGVPFTSTGKASEGRADRKGCDS